MTWKPHVTVATIVEREGRFLLVEELAAGRRVLNQPAGHLENGESLLEAVRRETLEETAWEFQPDFLVGIYRWVSPSSTFLRFTFTGNLLQHHSDRPLDPDIIRTLWLSPEDLLARSADLRSPLVLQGIEDYRRGVRFPLDMLCELPEVL